MRGVKNFLIILVLSFCGFLGAITYVNTPVYADDACTIAGESDPLLCGTARSDEEGELMARVKAILNTVYLWIGIIAVIVIVIGGVRYMISTGDSNKIKNAKSTITYAIIGLVVTLAAFAITNFIINALEGREDAGRAGSADVAPGDPSVDPNSPDRQKVRAISVVSQVKIVAGQKAKLKVKIIPDYAANQTISFTSADPSTVTVDKDGNISAKKEGETTITVASPEGISKEVKVHVQKPVAVKSITLSSSRVEVKKGKTTTVKATIVPSNAVDKTLAWESANTKIATVTQAGQIKGIKEGSTTVTVYARNRLTFAKVPTNGIVLAGTDISDIKTSPTVVTAKLTVTVPSETWEIADVPSTERNYKRKGKFTEATQKIVDANKSKFGCSNYKSFMESKGGYTAYVKSLGGIFAQLAGNPKKAKIKTAADFQAVAEYTLGLWTIWGPDYNNYYSYTQNNPHYRKWPGSDAFYYKCPDLRHGPPSNFQTYNSTKVIDKVLQNPKKIRTHCNATVDIIRKSTSLPFYSSSASYQKLAKHGKKITKVTDLQVGDVMAFFSGGSWKHTSIVGEVYKDYVVTYDGGSPIGKGTFKKIHPRKNTSKFSGYSDWYGIRVNQIDQTKTLKGL